MSLLLGSDCFLGERLQSLQTLVRGGLTLLLSSLYTLHTLTAEGRSVLGPKATLGSSFQGEMLVDVAFSPALFGLDSHLLQRVAHFNPLSLNSWFSRSSGRVSITAQVAHLIREGRVWWHKEEGRDR